MSSLTGEDMIDPHEFAKKAFLHTRKEYWGGSWYPYWSLMLVTLLGGFFGLDHIWLRSPQTGILKFVINILTFGLWYIYDVIQIFKEKDSVMQSGLSAPLVGPIGIGARMFKDSDPSGPHSKSPLRLMLYLIAVCLPFGLDFLVAGDTNGAIMRFVATILFPVGFIWGCVSMYRAFFTPVAVFESGTYRMFPFNQIMSDNGPSILGPKDIPVRKDACDPGGVSGYFRSAIDVLPIVIQGAVNGLLPGVQPAIMSVAAATQATAGTVKVAANTATEVISKVGPAASEILDTIKTSALPLASASAGLGQIIPTAPRPLIQQGGGYADTGIISDSAVIFILVILLGGGSLIGYYRLREKSQTARKNEQNDTPPRPQ
jgi:hypothetical protein